MKTTLRYPAAFVAVTLALPASADVIYSNLLDTPIPYGNDQAAFNGVTVSVNGGWINPFFGGVGVANDNLFQPARLTSSNLGTLQDFAAGATISGSLSYGTGFGGSQNHLGNTFFDGQPGYIGFKANGKYGWMRVVLTGNSAGAVIKDWAYETSGSPIVVGRVEQSAAAGNAQTVTLSPATGEAFTLGSAINDGGIGVNINSVVKTGAGTTSLVGTNGYTGTTLVADGTLLVNGSITGSGLVSVDALGTLGGTGSIAGAVTVNGGILSPGASIESLATGTLTLNDGSTFAYEMNSGSVMADFQKVGGDLALYGTVNLTLADLALSPVAFAANTTFSLINYVGAWNGGFFTYAGNELSDNEVFTAGPNTWKITYGATTGGSNFTGEHDLSQSSRFVNINLTAVPEPGSLLALGCLVGSGLFLRRRNA